MREPKKTPRPRAESRRANPFELQKGEKAARDEKEVHVYGNGIVCDTENRGHVRPRGRSVFEIVVDASEGFIPLWARDVTLRWRFQERSMSAFARPAAAKAAIERLLGEALVAWGDAAPVRFAKRDDAWDFEIAMRRADNCDASGCVLASAFFPDAGRHQLRLYPKMFSQSKEEQLETLIHEIGHIFGLRHFFADVSEREWASEIFGTHKRFSIMNYGADSKLTAADRDDLKRLYQLAWSGKLTEINGTPIRLVKPFHTSGARPENLLAVGQLQTVVQPQPDAAIPGET
ncbi:MAG TPA: matrixin family metalloprotease [Longimicrobium sp.]|nr:matrixin family metalloprotease [Longimicrobium sp.]